MRQNLDPYGHGHAVSHFFKTVLLGPAHAPMWDSWRIPLRGLLHGGPAVPLYQTPNRVEKAQRGPSL